MIEINGPVEIQVFPLKKDDAKDFLANYEYTKNFTSAIGHKETADILSNMLNVEIKHNRTTVRLGRKDTALVAQYRGPRLEEGATKLPDGAEIKFYLVKVKEAL